MRVLAIDPGVTTGGTWVVFDGDKVFVAPFQAKYMPHEFGKVLRDYNIDVYICENFSYRKHLDKAELYSLQLIGVLNAHVNPASLLWNPKAFRHEFVYVDKPGRKVHWQEPAYALAGFFTDDRLKSLNLYIPAMPHAMDALRHFMQWWQYGRGAKYREQNQTVELIDPAWIMSAYFR